MSYFSNFPLINYNDKLARNIILKSAIVNEVITKTDAFYPYVIKDYERPDQVAYDQYNDPMLDWVVYFSNYVVDPYYQWPLTDDQLKSYLEKKYNKNIYQLQSQIHHYEYTGIGGEEPEVIERKNWFMTPTTYTYSQTFTPYQITNEQNIIMTTEQIEALVTEDYTLINDQTVGWSPVYVYDYEYALNEKKRSIKLLSRFYLPQIKRELISIFK